MLTGMRLRAVFCVKKVNFLKGTPKKHPFLVRTLLCFSVTQNTEVTRLASYLSRVGDRCPHLGHLSHARHHGQADTQPPWRPWRPHMTLGKCWLGVSYSSDVGQVPVPLFGYVVSDRPLFSRELGRIQQYIEHHPASVGHIRMMYVSC